MVLGRSIPYSWVLGPLGNSFGSYRTTDLWVLGLPGLGGISEGRLKKRSTFPMGPSSYIVHT